MKKDICAIWILDELTNQKLNEVMGTTLDAFGIEHGSIYGHITFASLVDIDVDEVLHYTRKFAQGKRSFNINCSVLSLLSTNCIACIPSVSGKLLRYYEEYHKEFDPYCNMWTRADLELWLPHISLYVSETEDMGAIIGEMAGRFHQFKGKVVRLELSVVNENDFEIIYSYDLE